MAVVFSQILQNSEAALELRLCGRDGRYLGGDGKGRGASRSPIIDSDRTSQAVNKLRADTLMPIVCIIGIPALRRRAVNKIAAQEGKSIMYSTVPEL